MGARFRGLEYRRPWLPTLYLLRKRNWGREMVRWDVGR